MEALIPEILKGDQKALETLVKNQQPLMYNLAMRFLSRKEDAEDATQEIMVKIITNLAKFEGQSRFSTWAYRIAVNHLLNSKKKQMEQEINFSFFGEDILEGLQQSPAYELPDKQLLAEEVKLNCTLGMLLCLDRNQRIAYILGEIFGLNSREAAYIIGITPENFRKRLAAARNGLQDFMHSHCWLVNKENACRCHKRINYALSKGRISKPTHFAVSNELLVQSKNEVEQLHTTSAIFKSHPSFEMNSEKSRQITDILNKLEGIL
jgi:RNA polymerase sigma factor (sigma-70 family)